MSRDKENCKNLHHPSGCDEENCWRDDNGIEWHAGSMEGVYEVSKQPPKPKDELFRERLHKGNGVINDWYDI